MQTHGGHGDESYGKKANELKVTHIRSLPFFSPLLYDIFLSSIIHIDLSLPEASYSIEQHLTTQAIIISWGADLAINTAGKNRKKTDFSVTFS